MQRCTYGLIAFRNSNFVKLFTYFMARNSLIAMRALLCTAMDCRSVLLLGSAIFNFFKQGEAFYFARRMTHFFCCGCCFKLNIKKRVKMDTSLRKDFYCACRQVFTAKCRG